jgi:hypothetical protein
MNPRNRAGRVLWSLALAGALTAPAAAQDIGRWRALTAGEEKARIGDIPAESVDPSMIEADFDGDGRKDRALIAVRRADQVRDLIADMGDRIHVLVRSEEKSAGVGPEDGLGLAKPGRWETVCGNAFRDLQGGLCGSEKYPRAVTLKNPGLLHISPGEAILYFWDRKKKTFDAVALRN